MVAHRLSETSILFPLNDADLRRPLAGKGRFSSAALGRMAEHTPVKMRVARIHRNRRAAAPRSIREYSLWNPSRRLWVAGMPVSPVFALRSGTTTDPK